MVVLKEQLNLLSLKKNVSNRKLALATVLVACSAVTHAGKITSTVAAGGAEGFGGWNLDNIEVTVNGTQGNVGDLATSWFDEVTGAYSFAPNSDYSYQAVVSDNQATVMGYALAKDWPVGEPAGIKIVNDDFDVKEGRPTNCVMSTSYLDDHFLDTAEPLQVICSGPFQSHKRYKLAMLPTTVDGALSEGVDMVFNVEAEEGSRDYQIFQKINNWTDVRLEGFTIEIGFGIGDGFELASDAVDVGVDNLSIAVPESVWSAKQLATFSAGLFGPIDEKHDRPAGYFDPTDRAGFFIDEYPVESGVTDSLHATTTLGSDYADMPAGANAAANQFGTWIPNTMLPYGVFFDDDGDPATDAELKYWYGYNPTLGALGWMTGAASGFLAVDGALITALGTDLLYTMGPIDDLVNVGLNYLVTVGDVSNFPDSQFTIRITPTKDASNQPDPTYVGVLPVPSLGFDSSDGIVSITPEPTFAIGTSLIARVADVDVSGTVDVLISTDGGVADQTVTLIEQGDGRAVFTGAVPVEFSQVALGSTVTLTYTDLNDGNGNNNVVKTAVTLAVADVNFGIIQFTAAAFSTAEGDGTVSVTVERIGSTVDEATVEYSTQYNTAVGNEDYEAITGSLTFAVGETSQTIDIVLIDDALHEDDESFNVILSNVQGGAVLGNVNNTAVTISDDDPIIVQLSSATYAAVEDGGSVMLTVERNGGFETASVDYATSDNTAIGGSDYTAVAGSFSFAEGEVSKTIEVMLIDDLIHEDDESFVVALGNVSVGASLGTIDSSIVTIADNDPIIVQFRDANYTVTEEGGSVVIAVDRSNSLGAFTVDYTTVAVSAVSDTDFVAATGTLTFADGESSKEIEISILEDTIVEADETFSVTLSSVQVGAVIGVPDTTVITITDNDVAVRTTSGGSSSSGGGAINPLFLLMMVSLGFLLASRRKQKVVTIR
ncbi:MAG: choice-of-anchor F family protein [Oceanicoccus sp.]